MGTVRRPGKVLRRASPAGRGREAPTGPRKGVREARESTAGPASRAGVPRRDEDPTRARLLATAIELFTRRGYAATSVREIVEGAGVAKPALYYHFGSKEGIYLAILDHLQGLMDEVLEVPASAPAGARRRIEALFVALFDHFEANQAVVRFVNAVFWGPPQGAPAFDLEVFHARLRRAIERIVVDGIASGELRPAHAEDVVFALIGVLSFSMDLTLAHPSLGLGKAGLLRALDLLFNGIAAPKAAPQGAHP